MTDLARWKLRGPVRTVREEHADWDAAARAWGPPRHPQIVTFLPDGRFSESEFHNPDGAVARKAYLYDRDGRIVETRSWMEAHRKPDQAAGRSVSCAFGTARTQGSGRRT